MRALWALILAVLLTVSPSVSFEPATLSVRVRVDPAPENRLLVWSLMGENWGSQSQRDLEGEASPKTFFLPEWKGVPGGDYVATATVYNSSGKVVGQDSKRVHIESRGPHE